MDFDLLLLAGLYLFLAFVVCVFFFQRFRWRRRKRLGKQHLGYYPSSADMGNAFQVLQILVQPRVQYVIEEKLDEEADEDDSGGPDDPIRHLHRQAAKIRRGEKLERLTVLKR